MLFDKYCQVDEIEEDIGRRICRIHGKENLPNHFGVSDD